MQAFSFWLLPPDPNLTAALNCNDFDSYYRLLKPNCDDREIQFYKLLHQVNERTGREGEVLRSKGAAKVSRYKDRPTPAVAQVPASASAAKAAELPREDVDYATLASF